MRSEVVELLRKTPFRTHLFHLKIPPDETADLVTFTKEIPNGNFIFCAVITIRAHCRWSLP